LNSRRDFAFNAFTTLSSCALGLMTATLISPSSSPALAEPQQQQQQQQQNEPTKDDAGSLTVFKTPSGLKYLDLEPGTGPTPQYGQLVSIQYQAYIKLPPSKTNKDPKPELFEKQDAYLLKHGNGRTIAGLEEGLHTMQVGGQRRLLIPPKLGYVEGGLGPVPQYPWDRNKLNYLLDQTVALVGGTLIFEVRLLSAMDDEADQGYYQDDSLTPEEFQLLRENLQKKAKMGQSSLTIG
jgi:hypothetical protein